MLACLGFELIEQGSQDVDGTLDVPRDDVGLSGSQFAGERPADARVIDAAEGLIGSDDLRDAAGRDGHGKA